MIVGVGLGWLSLGATALAYIGPGPGLGMLGALLGLLLTIVTAVGAALAWPFRKAIKSFFTGGDEDEAESEDGEAASDADDESTTEG